MFSSILLPILLDHGVEIASPFVAIASLWVAARVQKATGVDIEKQLSDLFNSVLARAAEAVVREGGVDPVRQVIARIQKTNPDLVKRLKLNDPKKVDGLVEAVQGAVLAARDRVGKS